MTSPDPMQGKSSTLVENHMELSVCAKVEVSFGNSAGGNGFGGNATTLRTERARVKIMG